MLPGPLFTPTMHDDVANPLLGPTMHFFIDPGLKADLQT